VLDQASEDLISLDISAKQGLKVDQELIRIKAWTMNGKQSIQCLILMEMVEKMMVEKIMAEKITVDKIMAENAKKKKIQFIIIIIIMRNNILQIQEKSK
jgi:hypothetical protein